MYYLLMAICWTVIGFLIYMDYKNGIKRWYYDGFGLTFFLFLLIVALVVPYVALPFFIFQQKIILFSKIILSTVSVLLVSFLGNPILFIPIIAIVVYLIYKGDSLSENKKFKPVLVSALICVVGINIALNIQSNNELKANMEKDYQVVLDLVNKKSFADAENKLNLYMKDYEFSIKFNDEKYKLYVDIKKLLNLKDNNLEEQKIIDKLTLGETQALLYGKIKGKFSNNETIDDEYSNIIRNALEKKKSDIDKIDLLSTIYPIYSEQKEEYVKLKNGTPILKLNKYKNQYLSDYYFEKIKSFIANGGEQKLIAQAKIDQQEKERLEKERIAEERRLEQERLAEERKAEQERKAEERRIKAQKKSEGVRVGMTEQDVLDSSWGRPDDINRTVTSYGTSEQWVYDRGGFNYNFLYFDDGILTSIQN